MMVESYAWMVDVERAGDTRRFVVVGPSIVEAARHAQDSLAAREDGEARLVAIERLAPALLDDGAGAAAASADPPPQQPESTGLTRGEQLVAFLEAHGDRAHLHEIASALSTSTANAQNIIAAAVKKGLVERQGQRTGMVALVEPPATPAAVPSPAALTGRTRAEQVAEVVRQHGGEAHVSVIADELGTSVLNARNCVAAAVKGGLVERVGRRSGRVRLVDGASNGNVEPRASVPPSPSELTGIRRRVYDALVTLGKPATAKEIAGVLGCRPREAGNAAVLLVSAGLSNVDRSTATTTYSTGGPSRD